METTKQSIGFYWLRLRFSLKRIEAFQNPVPHTQSVFTCSKLAIETLKEGVKYVQT